MTTDEQALATQEKNGQDLQTVSDSMSISELTEQVQIIQNAMGEVMQKDEHYGTIPGTNKPTLYKAGAEKLALLFKLAPEYKVNQTDLKGGHREYEVITRLVHRPTGDFVGEGVGVCTTMETKYRYRKIEKKTDIKVPNAFWNSGENMKERDKSILRRELQKNGVDIPGGAEIWTTRDNDGNWWISLKGKGENPDIADTYNTVIKMAKKRSQVDATLTATAASDIFTQDVEDMDLGKDDDSGDKGGYDKTLDRDGKEVDQPDPSGQPANLNEEVKQKLNKLLGVLPDDHPLQETDLDSITVGEFHTLKEFLVLYRDVRKGIGQMNEKDLLDEESFTELVEKLHGAERIVDLEIIIDDMEIIDKDPGGKEAAKAAYQTPEAGPDMDDEDWNRISNIHEMGRQLHAGKWIAEMTLMIENQDEDAEELSDLDGSQLKMIEKTLRAKLEDQ